MSHAAHDDSHGHDAHGHADTAVASGPAEIPPAPETRFISPARSDFDRAVQWRWFLWPVLWVAVAAALFLGFRGLGWHEPAHEGGGHESEEHEAR